MYGVCIEPDSLSQIYIVTFYRVFVAIAAVAAVAAAVSAIATRVRAMVRVLCAPRHSTTTTTTTTPTNCRREQTYNWHILVLSTCAARASQPADVLANQSQSALTQLVNENTYTNVHAPHRIAYIYTTASN